MAVKLHCCRPGRAGRSSKALKDMGIGYELAGPSAEQAPQMIEHTGQKLYPAIEFERGLAGLRSPPV